MQNLQKIINELNVALFPNITTCPILVSDLEYNKESLIKFYSSILVERFNCEYGQYKQSLLEYLFVQHIQSDITEIDLFVFKLINITYVHNSIANNVSIKNNSIYNAVIANTQAQYGLGDYALSSSGSTVKDSVFFKTVKSLIPEEILNASDALVRFLSNKGHQVDALSEVALVTLAKVYSLKKAKEHVSDSDYRFVDKQSMKIGIVSSIHTIAIEFRLKLVAKYALKYFEDLVKESEKYFNENIDEEILAKQISYLKNSKKLNQLDTEKLKQEKLKRAIAMTRKNENGDSEKLTKAIRAFDRLTINQL